MLMNTTFLGDSFSIKWQSRDDTTEFQVKVIDTWNMTVEDRGVMKGKIHIELPGRQYMAVQMKKV